ncbi:MAG: von Willebrand factor type A domain-containing protein [Verrucomicrobiota bacterium]|nr:von Willebrand factor type A domain-containing protein [Verrucomicrobiota bacterium]
MNQDTKQHFTPDDPRLTAYAHGELHDAAVRGALEEQLARDPQLRAALDELRALALLLGASFAQETLPMRAADTTNKNRKDPIAEEIKQQEAYRLKQSRRATIRFYYYGAMALAACAAFAMALLWTKPQAPQAVVASAPMVESTPAKLQPPGNAIVVELTGPIAEVRRDVVLPKPDALTPVIAVPVVEIAELPSQLLVADVVAEPNPVAHEQKPLMVEAAVAPAPIEPVAAPSDTVAKDVLVAETVPSVVLADTSVTAQVRKPNKVDITSFEDGLLANNIRFGAGNSFAGSLPDIGSTSLFTSSPEETPLIVTLKTGESSMAIDRLGALTISSAELESNVGVPRGLGRKQGQLASTATTVGQSQGTSVGGGYTSYRYAPESPNFSGNYFCNPSPDTDTSSDSIEQKSKPTRNTEQYDAFGDNAFMTVAAQPLSTFSVDVDTGSYTNIRRFINDRTLPPRDAVRIEEMVNYFTYNYAASTTPETPFALHLAAAPAPWAKQHQLVRVALKGYEVTWANRPASNYVFLVDVSGSMNETNKLPLVRYALNKFVKKLDERDTVAIVTYAGDAGVRLKPTRASKEKLDDILEAISSLRPGGTTQGSAGIDLAYEQSKLAFVHRGINRVILCTDGDFNVGITDRSELSALITEKARDGVFLSIFGFGRGNLKDAMLEELARKGNGTYGYIDSAREADEAFTARASNFFTIAKDVKIQVEFNPVRVAAYRLIGYENRTLAKEDFNDDRKDAGDIGAGHTVTALYEIVPAGIPVPDTGATVDPLIYQKPALTPAIETSNSTDLFTIKLRYKEPDGVDSRLVETPFSATASSLNEADDDFRFASAVAAFGMLLRNSPDRGQMTIDEIRALAKATKGPDRDGRRAEFIVLVEKTAKLLAKRG